MPSWLRRRKTTSRAASEPARPSDEAEVKDDTLKPFPASPKEDAPPYDASTRSSQTRNDRNTRIEFSPSEENLYIAALEKLKSISPGPLPLWTESAPSLPPVEVPRSPIPNLHVPYPSNRTMQAMALPPGASGFPTSLTTDHALVTLLGDNGVRLTGFPVAVVAEIEAVLQKSQNGLGARSEAPELLSNRRKGAVTVWRAELRGKVWRLRGNQELESCRLLINVFTALGKHGYFYASSIQPASAKPEQHNLVFRYSPEPDPPCFMAVTVPVPDRISLISPPPAATAKLVEAVRGAINKVNDNAFREATPTPSVPAPSPPGEGIKLEGFIHPGVYRFWVAGLRRSRVSLGGLRHDLVAKFQPPLLLAVMDALAAEHFAFVGSVPFFPHMAGRDLMIFCSRPKSNLFARDGSGYTEAKTPILVPPPPPKTHYITASSRSESTPILVIPQRRPIHNRMASRASQDSQETVQTHMTHATNQTHMERLSLRSPSTNRYSLNLQLPERRTSYHSYNSFGSNNISNSIVEVSHEPEEIQPSAGPSLTINGHAPSESSAQSVYSECESEVAIPEKQYAEPDTPAFEYDDLLSAPLPSPGQTVYYTPSTSQPESPQSPEIIPPGAYPSPLSRGDAPIAPPRSPLRAKSGDYAWAARSVSSPVLSEVSRLSSSSRPPGVGSSRTRVTLRP